MRQPRVTVGQQAAVSPLRTTAGAAVAVAMKVRRQTEAEPAPAEAQTVTLRLRDIIGHSIWVAGEDADKVYTEVAAAFAAGRKVRLSFADSGPMVIAFLHDIIRPLYEKYGARLVESQLTYVEVGAVGPTDAC